MVNSLIVVNNSYDSALKQILICQRFGPVRELSLIDHRVHLSSHFLRPI